MKRAIIIATLLISAANAAEADTTYRFTDVVKPHGHVRSAAIRHADGRACGVSANLVMPKNIPAFEKCMAVKGWRFARITTSKAPAVVQQAPSVFSSSPADDAAAQAAEEAQDDEARRDDAQRRSEQQTQDMTDLQNQNIAQDATAAQEAATASAAASFDAQMTVGNQ